MTQMAEIDAAYEASVRDALARGEDVWAEELIAIEGGPTYENLEHLLRPLMHTDLTESTVYYLPLTFPLDGNMYALHVADGSAIYSEGSPHWTENLANQPVRGKHPHLSYGFWVGSDGQERFGSALGRLEEPALAEGFLPILRNVYEDAQGVTYTKESFAARAPDRKSVVSYVEIVADAGGTGATRAVLRMSLSGGSPTILSATENAILAEGKTVVVHDGAGVLRGDALVVELDFTAESRQVVHLACWTRPAPTTSIAIRKAEYDRARREVHDYWMTVLADGAKVEVPEPRVMDAMRGVLIQNLVMGHRYSIGNPYDMTFLMEGCQSIEPLLWFGHRERFREQLNEALWLTNGTGPDSYEHWEYGVKLTLAAQYYYFSGDDSFIRSHLDRFVGYMSELKTRRARDDRGILPAEKYAWDIRERIQGLHSQSWAWRGMRDMSTVFNELGYAALAQEYGDEAVGLGQALRAVISEVQQVLPDGTRFIPVDLSGNEVAYEMLTESKMASYWNIVGNWMLTSDLLTREDCNEVLEYMRLHGSWFLRMARFNGIYNPPTPVGAGDVTKPSGYRSSGIDNAWGVQATKALAENDLPDDLVLAFYAKLAHGMTRGTFIAGEGETIDPCDGEYFRSMCHPPNSTNNALLLDALRLMLVRERFDEGGAPVDLDIGPALPRGWLAGEKRVAVERLPTGFGNLSYEYVSQVRSDGNGTVEVRLNVPQDRAMRRLRIWFRAPARPTIIDIDGSWQGDLEKSSEFVDIRNARGVIQLKATLG